jgi:predicted DNA-binding transcriptional regulator AlpA
MDKQETRIPDRVRQNLLKLKDLESALGVCGKTIGRLMKAGRFPAPVFIGHSRRWRPEDVESYLAHQVRVTALPEV